MSSQASPTRIWRLNPAALQGGPEQEPSRLSRPLEFIHMLRPRHGIVLGAWDAGTELGLVRALGVVRSVDMSGAEVEWRPVNLKFRPNPTGRAHWFKAKPFFEFKEPVRTQYTLDSHFSENFPEFRDIEFGRAPSSPSLRLSNSTTGGFVYVLKSDHGYKIGKTVNLKDRTRLFAVKLPFKFSIEHYAWFDDYTAAERNFHQMFHTKRKEGEWFALDGSDLAKIKTFGERIEVIGL